MESPSLYGSPAAHYRQIDDENWAGAGFTLPGAEPLDDAPLVSADAGE